MTEQNESMVALLMTLNESMAQLIEAVDGHRAELQRRGYSETASEVMAMHFHEVLIKAAFKGTSA